MPAANQRGAKCRQVIQRSWLGGRPPNRLTWCKVRPKPSPTPSSSNSNALPAKIACLSSRSGFAHLDEVFSAAPYFSNAVTFIAVLPTASSWSVLWNNSFLCDGYDSLCWCLTNHHRMTTCHWSAHDAWTTFQSGAGFTHRAWRDGGLIERSVHCSQEDRRWIFAQHGDPLPEEDTSAYSKRKKPDRLNEAGVLGLLTKLGAQPWEESFYEISHKPTYLLSRPLPANASARPRQEVLDPNGHGSAGLRRPLTGL